MSCPGPLYVQADRLLFCLLSCQHVRRPRGPLSFLGCKSFMLLRRGSPRRLSLFFFLNLRLLLSSFFHRHAILLLLGEDSVPFQRAHGLFPEYLGWYRFGVIFFTRLLCKFRNNDVSWETGVCELGTVFLSICLGFLVSLGDHRSRLLPSRLTLMAWTLSHNDGTCIHFSHPLFSFAVTEMSI